MRDLQKINIRSTFRFFKPFLPNDNGHPLVQKDS